MEVEPSAGKRHVAIPNVTRVKMGQQIKKMIDDLYSEAIKVRLVMENLNTHNVASLYETFEPCKARRLAKLLEVH